MDCQDWDFTILQKITGKFPIFGRWKNSRHQISDIYSELLQGQSELFRRRHARDDFRPTSQNIFGAALPQILFEDAVRIVEIAEDQIEAREIVAQFRWKLGLSREKACKRSVFDGAN